MTSDGSLLALRDAYLHNRIDVFDVTGRVVRSMTVDDRASTIETMHWLRMDCLVLQRADEILALNPMTSELRYRIPLDAKLIDFGLDRSWMAIPALGGVLIVDKATGKSMKWLNSEIPGICTDLAVSPDHRRVAASMMSPLKRPVGSPDQSNRLDEQSQLGMGSTSASSSVATYQRSLVLWDIDSGNSERLEKLSTKATPPFASMGMVWVGTSHLWISSNWLFDVETRSHVGTDLRFETTVQGVKESQRVGTVRQSPDGRLWREVGDPYRFKQRSSRSSEQLVPVGNPHCQLVVQQLESSAGLLSRADRKLLTPFTTGVAVTADVFDTQTNRLFAQELLSNAVAAGYSVKPNGFRVELQGTLGEDKGLIKFKNSTMGIPKVDLTYRFLFPNGTEVMKTKFGHNYVASGSKYLVKSDTEHFIGGNPDGIEYLTRYLFDFKGLDPMQAMADEMFSGHVPMLLSSHVKTPTDSYLEIGGSYTKLPISLNAIGELDTNRHVATE
jgi:hypothetical protein